jgi:hypothetical protein
LLSLITINSIPKYLIIIGVIFVAVGIILSLFPKLGFFRLPGDIFIEKENYRIYVPVTTSIVLSLLLTGIFWLISYLTRK